MTATQTKLKPKTCRKCGEAKPAIEFRKDVSKRGGLRHSCRACDRISAAAHYAKNSEKIKANVAKYRAANPEKVRAVTAAWCAANETRYKAKKAKWRDENVENLRAANVERYWANPEKGRARAAEWYASNPVKAKESRAKWRAANPEQTLINCHNRRARKRENGGKLSSGLAKKLFTLQRGKCACGCKQPLGDNYHLDHRMPLALGGANEDWNMQLLRSTCNLQKHAKHPVDFMQQRGFLL